MPYLLFRNGVLPANHIQDSGSVGNTDVNGPFSGVTGPFSEAGKTFVSLVDSTSVFGPLPNVGNTLVSLVENAGVVGPFSGAKQEITVNGFKTYTLNVWKKSGPSCMPVDIQPFLQPAWKIQSGGLVRPGLVSAGGVDVP